MLATIARILGFSQNHTKVFDELGLRIDFPQDWAVMEFTGMICLLSQLSYPTSPEKVVVPRNGMLLVFSRSETTVDLDSYAQCVSIEKRLPHIGQWLEQGLIVTPEIQALGVLSRFVGNVLSFVTHKGIISAALFVGRDVDAPHFMEYIRQTEYVFRNMRLCE